MFRLAITSFVTEGCEDEHSSFYIDIAVLLGGLLKAQRALTGVSAWIDYIYQISILEGQAEEVLRNYEW